MEAGPSRAALTRGSIALRHAENTGRLVAPAHRAVARTNPRTPTLGVAIMAQDSAGLFHSALSPELLRIVDDVVLLDGGSRDNTAAAARSLGARVIDAPFPDRDFARQQTATAQASRADWVLILDTDEVVSEGLLAGMPYLSDRPAGRDGGCRGAGWSARRRPRSG